MRAMGYLTLVSMATGLAAAPAIRISECSLTPESVTPGDAVTLRVAATSSGASCLNFRIRTPYKATKGEIPRGFAIESGTGYAVLRDHASGNLMDNGDLDGDPVAGRLETRISTEGLAPGDHYLVVFAHNRPGMHADTAEGWLIARREKLMVPRLTVNARTAEGGYVTAEVLDSTGAVIPGFSRDDCQAFTGDAVDHVLTWRAERFPLDRVREVKKIRFILKNADLYSYMPDLTIPPEAITPATVVYDPAANGGLLPNDSTLPEDQRFLCGGQPKGYTMTEDEGMLALDLHSVGARRSQASCSRNETWTDETDWCLESWLKIIDKGNEPNYGLALWMRPDQGHRGVALYLSDDAVGFNSSVGLHDHRTLRKVPFNTTDRFHWYRMVHTGGSAGTVTLSIDGNDICSIPMAELFPRSGSGTNIIFGPNAGACTGHVRVARFGYRTGHTEVLLGPIPR